MVAMTVRRRTFGAGVALLAAALLALAPAGIARAAGVVDFGPISATSTFEQGIDVTQKVMAPDQVHRTEVLITEGSDTDATVADVTPTRSGGWTVLAYQLATPAGSIIPNTVVHFRFRITLADGTQQTGTDTSVRYADTRFDWKTFQGKIVTVHWVEGTQAFGAKAAAIGDSAIEAASTLLGVTETDPIDFFVYPDVNSFREVMGPALRENVGGVAFPEVRTLFAQIGSGDLNDPWVGIVVPHELTHLVFGTATRNAYHSPAHWLNEGLAVYLSQGFDASDRSAVQDAAGNRTLMPLNSLAGQFPTAGDRFGLAYAESVSAIDFMVTTYGKPALVSLIRSYADGRTDDQAFKDALGVDTSGFEAAWVQSIGATEPVAAGPRPAPTGALPPGWTSGGAVGATPAPSSGNPAPAAGSDAGWLTIVVAVIAIALVVGGVLLASRRSRRSQPPPGTPL